MFVGFESGNQLFVLVLQRFDIEGMDFSESFLYIIQLKLILSLQFVYLIPQLSHFVFQELSLPIVLICLSFEGCQQLIYLIVFESDHFLKSIHLNIEYLVLVLDVDLDVLQLVVKHLVEFGL